MPGVHTCCSKIYVKLIEFRIYDDSHKKKIKQWKSETNRPQEATSKDQKIEFATGDGVDSVTKWCQLISNEEIKVRVLDTQGLADSNQADGVIEANRNLFRSIRNVQEELKMKFDRVIYFLPIRGSPERADGNLQEELNIMHFFYGSAIFDSMVIAATYHRKKQDNIFTDDDKADTKKVLERSLELVLKSHDNSKSATDHSGSTIPCPPIEYISMECNGEDILRILQEAPVKNKSGLIGRFHESICSRCPVRILYPKGALVSEDGATHKAVDVIDSKGKVVDYQQSTCHPIIIPKYSVIHRYAGGIAHITSGGLLKAYEIIRKTQTFPGFFNSDEFCPVCKKPPGAPGCQKIGELCDVAMTQAHGKVTIKVDHASQLDNIKFTDSYEDINLKG